MAQDPYSATLCFSSDQFLRHAVQWCSCGLSFIHLQDGKLRIGVKKRVAKDECDNKEHLDHFEDEGG